MQPWWASFKNKTKKCLFVFNQPQTFEW